MKSDTSHKVLLAVALVVFSVSSLSAMGQQAAEDGVTEVDWFLNLTWFNYSGDWGEDMLSQLIADEYGLTFNFITPAQEGGAQINTMIAGGELPDLITVESWLEYRRRMAQAGLLWSYNDLIDTYDPSFWDIMKMDIFNWYQENDGETYGLPNFACSSADMEPGRQLRANRAFIVRSDMYDDVGRPNAGPDGWLDVRADEFLSILEDVKEIGTYNGLPIVPLQLYEFTDRGNASVDWLAQYFRTPFESPDGEWLWVQEQENYFQAIAFLNEAFNCGLLSPEAFTDTREQINQKVASGRAFALLAAPQDFVNQLGALYNTDEAATFEGFVLRNNDGADPTLGDIAGFGWLTTSVAKSTQVPDKIIELIHFLYSEEGQHTTWWGFEGETFNYVDGGTGIERTATWEAMSGEEREATYGGDLMMFKDFLSIMDMLPESRIPFDERPYPDEDTLKLPVLSYTYDAKGAALNTDPEDPRNDEMQTLDTELSLYWGKELPRMITAGSVEEARVIWEAAIEESYARGLAALIDYNNDRFQRTKEKLMIDFSWPPNER